MRRKPSLPPIPPLPFDVLTKVEAVENYARRAVRDSSNPVGGSFNTEQTSRLLRTCVTTVLDLQVEYYASLKSYRPEWITELAKKTIDAALELFPLFVSGESLRGELQRTVKDHLAHKASLNKPSPTKQPTRINRKKLRDSYLTNFQEVKILDICWAARQHYREWKRWLKDELKDGSTPDRAFREVLISGKRPAELSRKPRPPGWQ